MIELFFKTCSSYWILQAITTLFTTGVFLRSVITILGSPPSATLHRYMCRNDLPCNTHINIRCDTL